MSSLQTLHLHLESGVDEILEDKPINLIERNEIMARKKAEKLQNPKPANQSVAPAAQSIVKEARKLADNATSLEELREAIENFDGCSLKKTAMNTVFSDGSASAKVMFVGEAPGANEDEQGIPFCGQSGKLLDNIALSIDLTRDKNLYITNTIFWRPPGNRRPTPAELAICLPFVEKHIALINPELLVMVGSTALQALMPNETRTISNIRGNFFGYKNQYLDKEIKIVPIFHPSYLLRQPFKKKEMWEDMLKIKLYLKN